MTRLVLPYLVPAGGGSFEDLYRDHFLERVSCHLKCGLREARQRLVRKRKEEGGRRKEEGDTSIICIRLINNDTYRINLFRY